MKKTLLRLAKKHQSMSSANFQRPGSTSSIAFPKGLLNAPGENNCFLNSAVQVLWHLDVFRHSFRNYTGHACMGNACIFCALKVIFTQFQYGEEQALPPDALRHALAENFKDQRRFQLGCMDDASECFENILCRIHFHIAHDIKEDLCDVKHCVPHRKFGMTIVEYNVCRCGATSEPFPFTQMVNYVSCKALCSENRKGKIRREPRHLSFGELLRKASAVGDIRQCPSNCGQKFQIQRVVTNNPEVVSIGLVWDTDRPSVDHIMEVINCLGTTIQLQDIFHKILDDRTRTTHFILVGVVTYYGKHYSTFFYNTRFRMWIYFDDASVKQVGPNWRDVVERCRKGHYQPLLLLFADPNGRAVNMDTAPKHTICVSGPPKENEYPDAVPCGKNEGSVGATNIAPISINHIHYNSTSSSTSTQSYKSYGSFDSSNTVIYTPKGITDKGYLSQPSGTLCYSNKAEQRPPKPARSNTTSEQFLPVHSIHEFQPQVEDVMTTYSNNDQSRITPIYQNHVIEIGYDVGQSVTKEDTAFSVEEYYRRQEREQLEAFAAQKREQDKKKDIAIVSVSSRNLKVDSSSHLPKFPTSHDLLDFNEGDKNTRRNLDRRDSGEYDNQMMWKELEAMSMEAQTMNMNNRPKRQPSFQYAVSTGKATSHNVSAPNLGLAGTAGTDVPPVKQPQHTLDGSQSWNSSTQYRSDSVNQAKMRPQSARNSHSQRLHSQTSNHVVSHQAGRWQSPELQRSLTSSLSVPDLSETTEQKHTSVQNHREIMNGSQVNYGINLRDSHRRSTFGSQPLLNPRKENSNTVNSMTSQRSVRGQENVSNASTAGGLAYRPAATSQPKSLSRGYNIQSGFVTIPRKRPSTHSQNKPVKGDHMSDMVVKGNHPPAQKPDGYDTGQLLSAKTPLHASTGRVPGVTDHLQHKDRYLGYAVTSPSNSTKADALEVGSLGRDSGYRSGDRNSTSSGSIYSIDMLGEYSPQKLSPSTRLDSHQSQSSYKASVNSDAYANKSVSRTTQNWGDLLFEADRLIKKSRIAEKGDDFAAALCMSTLAITNIKKALKDSELDSQTRIVLDNMYQSTVLRSRSLHNCVRILQRQESNQSIKDDVSLNTVSDDERMIDNFQNMNLSNSASHSMTYPNQVSYSETFHRSESQTKQGYTRGNTEIRPQVDNVYPTNPQQCLSTSLQDGKHNRSNYPQYSAGLNDQPRQVGIGPIHGARCTYSTPFHLESSQPKDYQPVKYSHSQQLYRAESHSKGKEMPQYAGAAPLERPLDKATFTPTLHRTHSEDLLQAYNTGRRQSVKDKINIFERQQPRENEPGRYEGQEYSRSHSRQAARDYSQEQPDFHHPVRRTHSHTMPSTAQRSATLRR